MTRKIERKLYNSCDYTLWWWRLLTPQTHKCNLFHSSNSSWYIHYMYIYKISLSVILHIATRLPWVKWSWIGLFANSFTFLRCSSFSLYIFFPSTRCKWWKKATIIQLEHCTLSPSTQTFVLRKLRRLKKQ